MTKKVTIIDCDIGNRASIKNMLSKIGVSSKISRQPEDILLSDLIILPGVGSFDAFMNNLNSYNLLDVLNEAIVNRKIPILGICLGMQVLFENSAEGKLAGLNWIKGNVRGLKQSFTDLLRVPHIGWSEIKRVNKDTFVPESSYFYFVHSYYCCPANDEDIAGTILVNGHEIVVAVHKDNIYGVQFHPEKSHKYGIEFFKGFIEHVL